MRPSPRHLHLVSAPEEEPQQERAATVDLDATFRRHARYVGHIALRILGRPDEVEDLIQEVFLDAHRAIAELRDPEAVKGWLATLTVRKSVRHLRRRKMRHFLGVDEGFDYARITDRDTSPDDRALVGQLYRVLDTLPPAQRSAWVLRHVEGEKVERVAELCGCSLATAKRRIAAAHAAIYQELGDV